MLKINGESAVVLMKSKELINILVCIFKYSH